MARVCDSDKAFILSDNNVRSFVRDMDLGVKLPKLRICPNRY
jgi:hypothetical protein